MRLRQAFRSIFPVSTLAPLFLLVFLSTGCGTTSARSGFAGSKPVLTLTATPASLTPGTAATLTASATSATAVTISGSDGASYAMGGNGGTETVHPSATTTYTATATGSGGTATATTTVTVAASSAPPAPPAPAPPAPPTPAPTVAIAAAPASIAASSSSTLTVTATNAAQIVISGSDGASYSLPGAGGTQPVSPAATTTYTATATGPGGKATATASVTVTPNPAPAVSLSASPTAISASNSSLLTVKAMNATQVALSGSDGTTYLLAATGGTQAVSPAATTTYTVVATGPGGKTSADVTVTVSPNPAPTVTLTANPASITAGGQSTLTVDAIHATQVSITGSDGTTYMPSAQGATSATFAVSPSSTTTYTAAAIGPGGNGSATATVTVEAVATPSATLNASPSTVTSGHTTTLTYSATNATQVTITGSDNTTYSNLSPSGGTQSVSPASTATYTLNVTGQGGKTATAQTTVTVSGMGTVQDVDHVIFMLQENRSFDSYFGMLNPYRAANGWTTDENGVTTMVDGIDDKLGKISNQDDENDTFPLFKFTSTCVDDMSSAWLESYGNVSRYDFSATRAINMDGFVHTAEGYAKNCKNNPSSCSGSPLDDQQGKRAMGYYDQDYLNYYYYMASNFALSDRWFTPVSSKSTPNRIATYTGGTTQGLVRDPFRDDGLSGQLSIPTIFQELEGAGVTWKIYYSVTLGGCKDEDDCAADNNANYPATTFSLFSFANKYLHQLKDDPSGGSSCTAPAQSSTVVGDPSGSFCIDPDHVAPVSQFLQDARNGTLPSFAYIEAGYGVDDEHPGSGQSILAGQAQIANIENTLMTSQSWHDSVFFLAYDEAGGPYDHVPPVPGHSNDNTDSSAKSSYPDIGGTMGAPGFGIAVNADDYKPCMPSGSPTFNCDLVSSDPGAHVNDAPAQQGFAAQIGFRVPNMVLSPFTRKHYVAHIPMDHTAILKFVENRFIGSSAHLTNRDDAQPNLLDFFDFVNVPWAIPPTPPTPYADPQGTSSCRPANFAPSTATTH